MFGFLSLSLSLSFAYVSVIDYWFVVTMGFICNYIYIDIYDYVGDLLSSNAF